METDEIMQVIEYLSKKGYTKTEATLRAESANQDPDGRPNSLKTEEFGGGKYRVGFGLDLMMRFCLSYLIAFRV